MPSRMFQGIIHQMKAAVDRVVGVVDGGFSVVASSELGLIGETRSFPRADSGATENIHFGGYTYRALEASNKEGYYVFVEGEDEQAGIYASILAVALANIKQYNDEKHDKVNFIKNITLDNILPGDVYAKARELHFATDVDRVVLLVRITSDVYISVQDVLGTLFPDKQKDFVFNISETDTVLVKEIKSGIGQKDIEKLASSIVDTLLGEHFVSAIVGIGTTVDSIKDLADSFKEAQMALEVSKVFDTETSVVSYDNLGIARLIYQLPTTLCERYLKEVFKRGSIDSLDEETLFTIRRFFENNLNISETSRGLFVHRNTLVYRLEKIKKLTGLDLREFDHAIIFKVALMVKKYLNANSSKF